MLYIPLISMTYSLFSTVLHPSRGIKFKQSDVKALIRRRKPASRE
uniref:Uncharacterized protein n=1 Tax=Meloidogyne enterolobii TaxID=390850 RepID=A0A6V7WAJ5_MELEN|nr:unnamed protein product [Meloidogyne enterolobii]